MNMMHLPSHLPQPLCQRIIDLASPRLTPAAVGPANKRQVLTGARLAYNVKLAPHEVPEELLDGVLSLTFGSEDQLEDFEVVMYPPGGHFTRHHDGPDREQTLMFSLNHGYEGGEFQMMDLEPISLGTGDVVAWKNGPEAFHRCLPVTRGLKWICVVWVRGDNYESI